MRRLLPPQKLHHHGGKRHARERARFAVQGYVVLSGRQQLEGQERHADDTDTGESPDGVSRIFKGHHEKVGRFPSEREQTPRSDQTVQYTMRKNDAE